MPSLSMLSFYAFWAHSKEKTKWICISNVTQVGRTERRPQPAPWTHTVPDLQRAAHVTACCGRDWPLASRGYRPSRSTRRRERCIAIPVSFTSNLFPIASAFSASLQGADPIRFTSYSSIHSGSRLAGRGACSTGWQEMLIEPGRRSRCMRDLVWSRT